MQETILNGESRNIINDNIEKIKSMFPEVFNEDKIDFEKLQNVLGNYIDTEDEKYRFTWNGKMNSLRLSQSPSLGSLRPCSEETESRDWDNTQNLYIEGDNLEVLKLLQNAYLNEVSMIYIDPPYNTGKDFVYSDDFKDNLQNYKEITGQVDAEGNLTSTNSESSGRYHTNWLNMMYPRLRLARNLLKDYGLIFISISDIEVDNLKKICNEIFGECNIVADLIWANKEGGGSSDSKLFRIKHEHILVYAKDISKVEIKGLPVSNEDRYKSSDEYESIRGKYYLQKMGMGTIQYSESLDYPIETPDGTYVSPSDNNNGKKACWRWSKSKYEWGVENGFIEIKKDSNNIWTVYSKQYLNCDNEGNVIERTQRPMGVIDNFSSTQASKYLESIGLGNIFSYSKPYELIKYMIDRIEKNDGIILDFFSGSATTAHAVMQLNAEDGGSRKFIMVQLPEKTEENSEAYNAGYNNICEIGKARIRKTGDKIKEELETNNQQLKLGEEPKMLPDIGFKVFKLDTSNIKKWNPETKDIKHALLESIDNYVEGRTEEDVLYEIILKCGIDLTVPIQELNICDKKVYSVAMGALIICLDNNITQDVANEIARLDSEFVSKDAVTVVFKDNGFANDSVKTNIKETMRAFGIGKFVTV